MKQRPFCGAEIAENARFCLYCMARLTEATPVQTSSKRNIRWWVLLAAVFVLCAALWGALAAGHTGGADGGNSAVTTTLPTKTVFVTANATTTATTTERATSDTTVAATTDTSVTASTSLTTTAATTTFTTTTTETTTTATTTAATTVTTAVPTTAPPTTTALRTTAIVTTVGTTTTAFTQPTAPPPSGIPRVYWRAATTADGDGSTEDAAVITGFEYFPQGGVLYIPATVDGKTVIGIDMRQAQGVAFDIPSVCQRITALYLPPSIARIPDGLFVYFTNLRDLYIGSDAFYMPPTALPAVSARADALTLHTPPNGLCTFASDTFAACCFSLYSATHDTWDPTDIYGEGTV